MLLLLPTLAYGEYGDNIYGDVIYGDSGGTLIATYSMTGGGVGGGSAVYLGTYVQTYSYPMVGGGVSGGTVTYKRGNYKGMTGGGVSGGTVTYKRGNYKGMTGGGIGGGSYTTTGLAKIIKVYFELFKPLIGFSIKSPSVEFELEAQ